MTWVIVHHGRLLYRGSREEVLAVAEQHGLLMHVGEEVDDAGDLRRVLVAGRSWHADGTEMPARLARDAVMMPEQMLPRRFRRIAA